MAIWRGSNLSNLLLRLKDTSSMRSEFYLRTNTKEYLFPVFKFLSSSHADLLLQQGNVHIPLLSDFQNAQKYAGQIHDREEGSIRIRNLYTCYDGLAKNANGVLPLHFDPYEKVQVLNQTLELPLESSAYAYCVTQHFFSDSLRWAISERHKDKCVLITDFPRFLKLGSDALKPSVRFLDVRACVYQGRVIEETNPGTDSASNFILANKEWIHFTKPREFAHQREIRAIWLRSAEDDESAALNFNVAEIASICLPVTFSTIKKAIENGADPASLSYAARVNCKETDQPPNYKIKSPPEVCSPILHRDIGGEWKFGFWYGRIPADHTDFDVELGSGKDAGGVTGVTVGPNRVNLLQC